jgi:uroporphyrinogen III methyltransferase/synthase
VAPARSSMRLAKMGLQGKTILITRAASQSDDLRTGLESFGARVIEYPLTVIKPIEDWTEVDRAIENLNTYQWILFTSTNAVDLFLQRVTKRGSTITPPIAVIGSSTATQLKAWNLEATRVPATFRAEGMLELFPTDLRGVRFLFPRAEVAREVVPEELRRRGAVVDVIPVYRTERAGSVGDMEFTRILETVDAIVFTSPSAIRVFAETFPEGIASRSIPIAVIGPVAAGALEEIGLKPAIQPESATIPDLVQAIQNYFN